ncbi:MAG TPA: hypothetical protein VF629_05145 [Hymenobacter sp.]|jgi:hypothetical protein|uniref:hypothetical protein n=1 Tax=Hymenobacter sp. TaxID=1898978 RepID=UPI002ED89C6E
MKQEEKQPGRAVELAASHIATTSLTRPVSGAETEDPQKPVALLVTHGMGQQVPFATLAAVVELLQGPQPPGAPVVTHVRFLDPDRRRETWLPRAELQVASLDGQAARTVHVYETYWAPLTEGNISLSEVVRFMASAGWRGLRLRPRRGEKAKTFRRWLFGGIREFAIPNQTMWGLLAALLLVVSLVVVNTLLTLVAGANLLGFSKLSEMPAKLVDYLTLDLLILLGPALLAGTGLWLSQKVMLKLGKLKRKASSRLPLSPREARQLAALRIVNLVRGLTWTLLVVAGVALVVATFVTAWHYFTIDHALAPGEPNPSVVLSGIQGLLPGWLGALPEELKTPNWAAIVRRGFIGAVWGATVGISLYLRSFLVQYMGDVAIYLDAYKVDRFHRVRKEVRRQAYQTACALYGARQGASDDPRAPLPLAYDRIVLAGHSLGSVVAYDALNATLHLDESMGHPLHADARTGGLITFGSPLDKTAYIFHTQTNATSVRPPLTASVQPLLRAWRARHYVTWINIHSPNDIISGKLDYYDAAPADQIPGYQAVDNRIDEDARTPLAAHGQYWNNQALAQALRERIFAQRPEDPATAAQAPGRPA